MCEWDFPVNLVLLQTLLQIMTTAPSKCAVWRTFFTNRTILLKAAHGGYLASMLVRQQFIAQLQLVQSKPPIIWHQNHICHMAICLMSIVVFYCLSGMLCPCGYDRVDKFPWLFCCFLFDLLFRSHIMAHKENISDFATPHVNNNLCASVALIDFCSAT